MGYALAFAAVAMGADVTLISGPTALPRPDEVEFVAVETTSQMHEAVMMRLNNANCLIMAAAPADFTPAFVAHNKIKKQGASMTLDLAPTIDILADASTHRRKGQILVGFALETDHGVDNARKKLRDKKLDVIILNSPVAGESGFDTDTNRVTVIWPDKDPVELPTDTKDKIAESILELLSPLL